MAAPSPISLNFLPRSLRKALLNFQKEGVRFGISKQGRCLIGDEMGLGKTLQAISIAYYYKDAWPLLIVVPSSVKFSWIEEIEKWLPEVEPHNINLIRSGSDISNLGKAIIHVIGYGLLSVGTSKLLTEALESYKFNVVILDESHYLKTQRAARTKRLHQLCKKAKHAILLSGTPSLARPRELYFQLDIVCPGKFGSFNSFVKRYCDAHSVYYRGKRHYDTSGASNLHELYNLLRIHVMMRRLKKEVLTQLPPKRRQKVTFDISESSSEYKKELQQVMKDFKKCSAILKGSADDPSIQSPLFEMNRLSTLLYHYTGLVKIGPVLKYIEDLAQGMDSKFIVFFRHRLVCQAIVQKLVTLKIKHICIAGDVASSIRGDLVHSFQTDPQVRIAVLSIEAASFGLTLTAAHHVVFAELHHTPGVIIQAEDRAHRIGQTLPVNVHYLIARGTVDEILWGMIRRKVYVTSSTLDGVCQELQAEDGDEDQGRQLSACAAWVQDQEEDTDELEEFVMEQIASKTKQDNKQRDLRSFFTPSLRARSSQSNCSSEKQRKSLGILDAKTRVEVVSVLDSDEDDDDALKSVSLKVLEKAIEEFKQPAAETPQESDNSNAEKKPVTGAKEMLRGNSNVDAERKPVTKFTEMLRDNRNVDTERKPVSNATEMLRDDSNVDAETKPVTNATEMLRDNSNVDAERKLVTSATEMFQDDSDVDVERNPATRNAKTLQNNRELNVEREPATFSVDENCLLKPKMLKFRKVKDGKLTFVRTKSHTKPQKKETECKVSPLEIVGNDPDSESQTLQSYLDDECERSGITKAEMQDGDMEKIGCTSDDFKPGDRGFFASLQDADVECVAVVCKKTSSRMAQSSDLLLGDDTPLGAIQRDENDAFDDEKLDSKQNVSEERTRIGLEENASASSLVVANSTCKLKSEPEQGQILVSTEDYCTLHGDLTENNIRMESLPDHAATEKVDGPDSHPSGNKTVEHLSTEDACSHLNLCKNGIDVDAASSLPFTSVKVLTKEKEFPHPICNNVTNEDVDCSTKRLIERADGEFHSSKDMTENKSVERSSNSLTCLQQLSEAASSKIETGEKTGGRRSVLIDEDSSDDFEVFHVKHTQPTRPRLTQTPPKKNKRKGNKKSKINETTIPKRRCCKKNQLPPSWSCRACTFLNDGQLLECSICFTPRVTIVKAESQIPDNVDCKDSITVNNDFKVVKATLLSAKPKSSYVAVSGLQNRLSSGEVSVIPEGDGSKGAEVLPGSFEVYGLSSASEQRVACKDTCYTSIEEGGEVDSGLPPWSCSVCTFSNMSELIECSMCLTPRRRSQRLSARHFSPKVNENKSKLSRKRRYKRETVKKNEIQRAGVFCNSNLKRVVNNNSKFTVTDGNLGSGDKGITGAEMESSHGAVETVVGVGDESLTHEPMELSNCAGEVAVGGGDEVSASGSMESSHRDPDAPSKTNDEGLTPEPMETLHGNSDDEHEENLTILKDSCNSVKPRPRKRLKLEEYENDDTLGDKADCFGISEDQVVLSNNSSFVSGSSPLAFSIQKYSKETILSDGKQTTRSADCVASKDVVKVEKAQHISELDKNNYDKQCDLLEPLDHSMENNKTASTYPSFETVVVEESNSRQHVREETQCQLEENLEELKAAAEEIFISEWEDDDDSWWEDDSSSGQSSYPSSCDTTSSTQSLTTNSTSGFAKCSALYSLSELKNGLQSGAEQSKAPTGTTANAGNAQPLDLSPGRKMMAVQLPEEKCAPAVEEEEIDEPEEIPEPLELKFCLSFYTERVYLYNEDNKPLGINFCMSDVINGNTEDLPNVLHHDYNLKQMKRFLSSWKRMGEGKKRVLRKSALVFDDPLEAYERARKGATRESCYVRHPSKETQIQKVMDTAEEIGGNVRVVKKPRMRTKKTNNGTRNCQGTNDGRSLATSTPSRSTLSTNPTLETTSTTADRTCYQVVRADGIPLCLFCSGPVEFAESLKCSDWDQRFCSHDCKKEYQVRVSGTAARRELFEAERGVCQLCSLDAHSLYLCVTALHVRDRPAYLAQTPYASLPQQTLKKMVMEPKEGMFWEADHITPVSEGGGECGLDNYRTLCVMCHRKETGALNKRLKQHKALQHAAEYADISTFFRPPN